MPLTFCSAPHHQFIPKSGFDLTSSGSTGAAATASLLWILASPLSEAIITNLSVIQIPSWFFALTPFEAIFTGFTFLWICALQYFGILPINLNNLFYGSPSGRRKRRSELLSQTKIQKGREINPEVEKTVQIILQILRRMDKDECVPRVLCELEMQSAHGYSPPIEIQIILDTLKLSTQLKESPSEETNILDSRPSVNPFEFYGSAVNLGCYARNSSICADRFSRCNLTQPDILEHVQKMNF